MRRLLVDQRESDAGHFWYVVRGGNRQVLATSEMYPNRSNALRAARRFIDIIDPVPVRLTYWTGDRPGLDFAGRPFTDLQRTRVSEDVR